MSDIIGQVLDGKFEIIRLVGSGGMANVYEAYDHSREVPMAIKVLRPEFSRNQEFIQFFTIEARNLSKLDHRNIVRFHEFNHGKFAYLVLEWIDGYTLRDLIRKNNGNPLSITKVIEILEAICPALSFAHRKKIIHCDIKPANILIDISGKIYLSDFGVARLANERRMGGTPHYMSPEQFKGEMLDGRSDIYSLGITLFEVFSGGVLPFLGNLPFSNSMDTRARIEYQHLKIPAPSLQSIQVDVPLRVQRAIEQMLDKSPSRRPSSSMEVLDLFSGVDKGYEKRIIDPLPLPPEIENINRKPESDSKKTIFEKLQKHNTNRKAIKFPFLANSGTSKLVALEGEYYGETLALPKPDSEVYFGRRQANDYLFSDRSVSRDHAVLLCFRKTIYIKDLNSKFGTQVNGELIAPDTPVPLHNGDVITIGQNQRFEFRNSRR